MNLHMDMEVKGDRLTIKLFDGLVYVTGCSVSVIAIAEAIESEKAPIIPTQELRVIIKEKLGTSVVELGDKAKGE